MMRTLATALFACTVLAGCQSEPRSEQDIDHPFKAAALVFKQHAQTHIRGTLNVCKSLKAPIREFLKAPSEAHHHTAQLAFQTCYQQWVSSQLFFQHPFDDSESAEFHQMMARTDARPFSPGYIDGVEGYPFSGLIHALDESITKRNLLEQHQLADTSAAAIGFPALETLLWRTPVDTIWQAKGLDRELSERRVRYVDISLNLLLEELTRASLRWRDGGSFDQLSIAAQQQHVLQSLQRFTLVDLLDQQFSKRILSEPTWYHLAPMSGQGRSLIATQLNTLDGYVAEPSFTQWLAEVGEQSTIDHLKADMLKAQTSLFLLPPNYPMNTPLNATWESAQRAMAKLALTFSELSIRTKTPLTVD